MPSSTSPPRRPTTWLERLLAARVPRERHRAGGDGRLQPDAGGLSLRPAAALRARPGAEDPRGRGKAPQRPGSGSSPTPSRADPLRRPRQDREQLDDDRDRRLPSARSGSALPSGVRWTPPFAASTTSNAVAGSNRSASPSRCWWSSSLFFGRQHLPAGDGERDHLQHRHAAFRGSPKSKALDTCCSGSAPPCSSPSRSAPLIFWAVPERPHAVARGLARRALRHDQHRSRQLAVPGLPGRTSPASRASARRSASSSSPCSGSTCSACRSWSGAVINSLRFELHDTGEMPTGPASGPCPAPAESVPAEARAQGAEESAAPPVPGAKASGCTPRP